MRGVICSALPNVICELRSREGTSFLRHKSRVACIECGMSFFVYLGRIVSLCNRLLLGPALPLFLILAGVFLSVRLSFFPFRLRLRRTVALLSASEAGTSPLRAMSMALAGTLGVGNITGVALALVGGGAGAVFWMWVSALFASVLKFGEITLALRYRRRTRDGYVGGAPYYIEAGVGGRLGRKIALVFAALCLFSALSFGPLMQANAVSESFAECFHIPPLCTGLLLAVLTAAVIFGGAARISALTMRLVPLMSILYVLMTLAVILRHADGIPAVLALILGDAFSLKSAGAGVLGYGFLRAMRYGTTRGLFSNEAGCGTAPMAHATASTALPAKQGLYGILEVFLDTGVICTLTAFSILLSLGVPSGDAGTSITAAALRSVLGAPSGVLLSFAIFFFAYATVITWAYYGEQCCLYLFGRRGAARVFSALFCLFLIFGATASARLVWEIADLTVSVMTLINCICLLLLAKEIKEECSKAGLLK